MWSYHTRGPPADSSGQGVKPYSQRPETNAYRGYDAEAYNQGGRASPTSATCGTADGGSQNEFCASDESNGRACESICPGRKKSRKPLPHRSNWRILG